MGRDLRKAYLYVLICNCQIITPKPEPALGTFPYHPVVYELDLAILSYQLHGQTLVWPFDPYYEEYGDQRDTVLQQVRGWTARRGDAQLAAMPGLDAYRGPGVLAGLPNAADHDPIIYDYARLHPQSDTIVNAEDLWTEYKTPAAITHRIRDVYVSARPIGSDTPALFAVPPGRIDYDADAADTLCAFEGGTGDRGDPGEAPSWSIMGFALARDRGDGGYDVHVTFRGSRSGSAVRAAFEALSSDDPQGNPDWITDLGWFNENPRVITTTGGVHRGFAHSMESILPGAMQCLAKLDALRGVPVNIYVSGHSLGGGLAQLFASAALLGDRSAMPAVLANWPWSTLKLVTFSAPRAGDYAWASALSQCQLASPFFDPGPIETVDADARVILDPGITTRLVDASQPAAFRVLISTDPITTTKFGGDGTHVGQTVYVNGSSYRDWIGIDNAEDHEPMNVRKDMTDQLADPRTPPSAWAYFPVTSGRDVQSLSDATAAYYRDRGLYFDDAALASDTALLLAILGGQPVAKR